MSRLGAYEIVRPLGTGATAEVFLGRDVKGHEVAVKVLRPTDAEAQVRFEREVALLTELSAAVGVLPVLASARTPDGRPYLVTPYMRGGSLRDRLEAGPLEPAEAVRVVTRLAAALAQAHTRGIVHRDVKPENVLFHDASGGDALLADLGLAKFTGVDIDRGTLSVTGQLRGSLAYMAPEQARDAKRAGPPADVYALGVVLFECLTGTTPFSVEGGVASFTGGTTTRAAGLLSELNPDAPRWIERILARCLHPEPGGRYPDAGALHRALERRGSRGPRAAGVAVVVAVVSFGAGALALAGRTQPPPQAAATPSPAPSTPPLPPPPRPALEVARELAQAEPLDWRAVRKAAEGALRRPQDADGLVALSERLVRDARARAARGGPFPEDVDAELRAAQELAAPDPDRAAAVAVTRARWLAHRDRKARAREALQGIPRTAEVRYVEARLLGQDRQERRAAYVALSNADPKSFFGRLARAAWLSQDWQYEQSTALAAELLKERPDQEDALIVLAIGHAWRLDPETALRAAARLQRIWPDSARARRIGAKALARLERNEEALAAYAEAIALTEPLVNATTHTHRGQLQMRLRRWAEARADFDVAAKRGSLDGLLWRGVTHWILKDRDAARADWKTAHQRSAHWFSRRLGDLPAPLWETMCAAAGIEVPRHLRPHLRRWKAKARRR